MGMYNPPHPGRGLHHALTDTEGLGLSVTEAADALGITRNNLSRVLHGHAAISPSLAHRLELAGIGRARHWLDMQTAYDLWQVQHRQPTPTVRVLYDRPVPTLEDADSEPEPA